jgi:putative NADH-flavin reductase
VWGTNDAFFTEAGARAYLADLPQAELHTFATGHFALEERLGDIAPLIAAFLDRTHANDPVHSNERGTPMKLAVIGATGHLGGAIAHEAIARGHVVTALGHATADITDPAAIADAVAGHDAVVASVKGPDRLVPRGAASLLEALPKAGVRRLLFVGGGASLRDASGKRFVDSPDFPAEYLETARDQAEALDILRSSDTAVEWSYISPPPMHLLPGDKTGTYRTAATDQPILGEDGDSRITLGDLAAAAVDSLDDGSFVRQRFTAAY